MKKSMSPQCGRCESKEYRDGKDCFLQTPRHRPLYYNDVAKLHKAASAVEANHYCKETRLDEIILLASELGYQKIGWAFCIGLSEEAGIIENILSKHFEVVSVCARFLELTRRILVYSRSHQKILRSCATLRDRPNC